MAKRSTTKPKKPAEETVNDTVDEVEFVDEPQPVENKPVIGVVTGCRLLNIRQRPDLEATILCFVHCDSEITVDMQNSSAEWLKVRNSAGVEGYCMARYVYIKQ